MKSLVRKLYKHIIIDEKGLPSGEIFFETTNYYKIDCVFFCPINKLMKITILLFQRYLTNRKAEGFNPSTIFIIRLKGLLFMEISTKWKVFIQLKGRCAAEPRSYHIAGGIPVE